MALSLFPMWELGMPTSDVDRLFSAMLRPSSEAAGQQLARMPTASVDVVETKDAFEFHADVPGMKKEDIKVQVLEGRVLSISGERKQEEKKEGDNYHRVERSYGSFERAFKLPENTDPSKVTAKHENGVLTITVQKRQEEPKTTAINIDMVCMAVWEVALPLDGAALAGEKGCSKASSQHRLRHQQQDQDAKVATATNTMVVNVDVVERQDAFEFHADVPGFLKEDLAVQVLEGGVLSISGERKRGAVQEDDKWHRLERKFGTFERTFKLPKTVDASIASAKHDGGVLMVSVAKRKEETPKTITVEVQ
eukprot:jgi/Chlat1/7621/Chrsp64S07160